jgi:hypothetical protein
MEPSHASTALVQFLAADLRLPNAAASTLLVQSINRWLSTT